MKTIISIIKGPLEVRICETDDNKKYVPLGDICRAVGSNRSCQIRKIKKYKKFREARAFGLIFYGKSKQKSLMVRSDRVIEFLRTFPEGKNLDHLIKSLPKYLSND